MTRLFITRLIGSILIAVGLILVVIAWRRSNTVSSPPSLVTPERVAVRPSTAPDTFTPTPVSARSPTPIPVPTETRVPSPTPTPSAVATRTPTPLARPTQSPGVGAALWQGRSRVGVGAPDRPLTPDMVEQLGLGWYLNWNVSANPARPGGIEFVQMIRMNHGVLNPNVQTIASIARAVPGSLWLVGNEPDRAIWQDDSTPVQYAAAYRQAYQVIKQADPKAAVAIAGVIQPTPLRLRYLDAVLAAYQQLYGEPMPVDVWNVHNFILREERGAWGAEIPPGLPDERGTLREIDDSDRLEIFKAQIVAFRRWMRDHGQRDKPLIVSEYGVLMPPDYGFGPERMGRFLRGTFDFLLSASDPDLGYPADGNRLVQRWCWYSLSDTEFPAGNLFDPRTLDWTAVGKAWREYVASK